MVQFIGRQISKFTKQSNLFYFLFFLEQLNFGHLKVKQFWALPHYWDEVSKIVKLNFTRKQTASTYFLYF